MLQSMANPTLRVTSKYYMPRQNEPLRLMWDDGNGDGKMMIHEHFGEETFMPNCIAILEESEYQSLQMTYQYKPAVFERSAIMKVDGVPVIVGQAALDRPGSERRMGNQKYERQYLRSKFAALAYSLYRASHNRIHLTATHPARLPSSQIKALLECFNGSIEVELPNSEKISFTVKKTYTIEEPVAAFQTYALNTEGTRHQRRPFSLNPGTTFGMVDIGSFISHMAQGVVNSKGGIDIQAVNAKPINYGISHVIETFETSMKDKFTHLAKLPHLPPHRITEALKTDTYYGFAKKTENVADIVEMSFKPLLNALQNEWSKQPFYSGEGMDAVILLGGGNALAQEYLNRVLFSNSGFPCEDDPEQMRYGAIRGASKGMIPFLSQQVKAEKTETKNG